MSKFRLLTCAIAAALLPLAACASPESGSADPTSKPGSDAPTSEDVTFGEHIAQIRGHHLAASELYADGDTKGASTHTGHPIDELLSAVRTEVAEHDDAVAERLEPALRAPADAVADGAGFAEVAETIGKAEVVLVDAETAVVGDKLATSAYRGSVIAALLSTVGHEYEEAVRDGKLVLEAEYQDAYAFATVAREMYDEIAADVREAGAEEAEEIAEDWKTLARALPGAKTPSSFVDNADVEQAATHVGAELAETVDAVLLTEVSNEDAIANINDLLDEILETYEDGDADAAAELAAEAYLENYELIEADVIEHAPDVNGELEPLLGSTLRQKIQDGAPLTELTTLVERARELLADAEEALAGAEEEEH